MKKQELEAILGDGENTPDLGPIEDYLHAVATERSLPDLAVGMCTLRIEEAAPKLRAVLLRAADGKELSDDESLLLFRGLHILGGARDRAACQPLLRLLRRPFQEVNGLLGDIVIESLANIVTGVFDDDIDALFALIIDRSIDGFIRDALFGAGLQSRSSTTLRCFSAIWMRISWKKRSRKLVSVAICGRIFLMATGRPSRSSRASQTSAMPPTARRRWSR